MITFAFIIGLYSYLIFFLGIFSILYPWVLQASSICVVLLCYLINRQSIKLFFIKLLNDVKKDTISLFTLCLVLLQIGINSIGVFGPELGFDALWYHLTLPKLYLIHHSIFHIPGSLLYYSDMPKLGEMLYVAGLSWGTEIIPKFIQFSFGILTICLLYSILRRYTGIRSSLVGVVIFYTSLVVGWESTSAYIDLIRTFYELLGLFLFLQWREKKEEQLLILSAIMIGFAITTKLLAIGSVVIFIILILSEGIAGQIKIIWKKILMFFIASLLVPLPWFVFSFVHTGNIFYPFFSQQYRVLFSISLLNPLQFLTESIKLFLFAADPVSPFYIIFLPLIIISFVRQNSLIKLIAAYCFLALVMWYITPRTGGGRFILPYLPACSILIGLTLEKYLNNRGYKRMIVFSVFFVALISIVYRGIANGKYIPYLLGSKTKNEFLRSQLKFSFGDFYDIDNYFKNNISKNDRVLLYGFHNLYYVDFAFIHSSWVKKGDKFNYIATQNTSLPKRFSSWKKLYTNSITKVTVYTYAKKMEIY